MLLPFGSVVWVVGCPTTPLACEQATQPGPANRLTMSGNEEAVNTQPANAHRPVLTHGDSVRSQRRALTIPPPMDELEEMETNNPLDAEVYEGERRHSFAFRFVRLPPRPPATPTPIHTRCPLPRAYSRSFPNNQPPGCPISQQQMQHRHSSSYVYAGDWQIICSLTPSPIPPFSPHINRVVSLDSESSNLPGNVNGQTRPYVAGTFVESIPLC